MEGEDHYYALARSDVSKPFRVFLIDYECPLHVGNAPDRGSSAALVRTKPMFLNSMLIPNPQMFVPGFCFLPIRGTAYGKSLEARQKVVERFLDPYTLLGRMG